MNKALEEAEQALAEEEVPVGAVVVRDGMLLGRGHNRMQSLSDPTAHAEMLAITAACERVGEPRLEGADLFVTLEPCAMCAGAVILARINRLFIAVDDLKTGACGSVFDVVREPRLNHRVEVYRGVLSERSQDLLAKFFATRR